MLTGVSDLKLLPDASGSLDLIDSLSELFNEAKKIRASIAFWTLPPGQLNSITGGNGLRVFCKQESYLCVDIQYPTNIDHLAELVRLGTKVYLNVRKLPKRLDPRRISTSPGLLHTKFILADLGQERAEVWIGSHNWTVPALIGPNTELSIALKLAKRAPLYLEAEYRLDDIRDNYCQPFNISSVDYYKDLQRLYERDTKSKNVIELEGDDVEDIADQVICVFGTEQDDFSAVSSVNRKVFLSVYDSAGSHKYLYHAKILQTGLLSSANPMADGLSLSKRRYAFKVGRSFPKLKSAETPGPDVLNRAYFFVNIQVIGLITTNYYLFDSHDYKVKESRWANAKWDPALGRMDPDVAGLFYKTNIQYQGLIEVPRDSEKALKDNDEPQLFEYSEMPIDEKRIAQDYRLISKRVIEY